MNLITSCTSRTVGRSTCTEADSGLGCPGRRGERWAFDSSMGPEYRANPGPGRSVDHRALQALSTQAFSRRTIPGARLAAPPPLQAAKPIGLLAVSRPLPFPDESLEFLARLSARASIAIQNARLYQAVQRANLEKSKFVSIVSHELRIPMTSIKGYSDLLLKQMAGPVTTSRPTLSRPSAIMWSVCPPWSPTSRISPASRPAG